ncbi:unnamed protein product [Caenorhabditis angaria]|uniref:Uncharacterized protein n=1 Tax=Caenorhabditis angaria TaxID=860376 RepID=A0A9P1ILF5_9PELO|nr:unnamed protein product [Caenorhabditis angaria]
MDVSGEACCNACQNELTSKSAILSVKSMGAFLTFRPSPEIIFSRIRELVFSYLAAGDVDVRDQLFAIHAIINDVYYLKITFDTRRCCRLFYEAVEKYNSTVSLNRKIGFVSLGGFLDSVPIFIRYSSQPPVRHNEESRSRQETRSDVIEESFVPLLSSTFRQGSSHLQRVLIDNGDELISDPETEPETELETEPETELETESETEQETEQETEPETEAEQTIEETPILVTKREKTEQRKCYLHLLELKGNELKTAIHSTNFVPLVRKCLNCKREVALKEEEKGVFSFRCNCGTREGARSNTCFSRTNLSWEKIVSIIFGFSKGFDNKKIKELTKSTTHAIQNLRDALQFVDPSSDFDGFIQTIATHNQSLMEQRKD